MDRVVLGQHANNALGAGLFVSNPGIDVNDAENAQGGNLAFDSSTSVIDSLYVAQSGTFTIECERVPVVHGAKLESHTGSAGLGWKVLPDLDADGALGASGGVYLDTGSVDIGIPPGAFPDGVIPEIALRFAVGNSSGHFHPYYSKVTTSGDGFGGVGGNWNDITSHETQNLIHMDSPWVRFKWGGKSIQTETEDEAQFAVHVSENNLDTKPLYESDGSHNTLVTPEQRYRKILLQADTAYGRIKGASGLIYFANSTNIHIDAHMTPTHSGLRTPTRENIRLINEALHNYKQARNEFETLKHPGQERPIRFPELNALWTNAIDDLAHFAYPTSPYFPNDIVSDSASAAAGVSGLDEDSLTALYGKCRADTAGVETGFYRTMVFRADGTDYGRGTYYAFPQDVGTADSNVTANKTDIYRWINDESGVWGDSIGFTTQFPWGNVESYHKTHSITNFIEQSPEAYMEYNDKQWYFPRNPQYGQGDTATGAQIFAFVTDGQPFAQPPVASTLTEGQAQEIVAAVGSNDNLLQNSQRNPPRTIAPDTNAHGYIRVVGPWPNILDWPTTATGADSVQFHEMQIASPQRLINMNIWENGYYVDECWPGHFGHKENFYPFLTYEEFVTEIATATDILKGLEGMHSWNWGQTPILKSAWSSLWNYDSLNYDSHAPFIRAKNPDGWYGHPSDFFVNPFSNATLTFNSHFPPPYDPTYINPRSHGRLGLYDYHTKDGISPGPRNTYGPLSNPTRPQTGLNAWLGGHNTDVARFGSSSGNIVHSPGLNFEALTDWQGSMGLGGAGSKTSLKTEDCWNTYYCSYVIYGHKTSAQATSPASSQTQANKAAASSSGSGNYTGITTLNFVAASKTIPSYGPTTLPISRGVSGPLGDIYQEQKHGGTFSKTGIDYGHNRFSGGLQWTNLVFPDDFIGTLGDATTDPFWNRRDSNGKIYGNVKIVLDFPEGEFYGSTRFNYATGIPDPVITLDFSDSKWNRSGENSYVSVEMRVGGVMVGGGGAGGWGSKNQDGLGPLLGIVVGVKNQLVQQYDAEGNPIIYTTQNTLRHGGGGGHGGAGSYLDSLFMTSSQRNFAHGGKYSSQWSGGNYPAQYERFKYVGVGNNGRGWGFGIGDNSLIPTSEVPLTHQGKPYGKDYNNTGQIIEANPGGHSSTLVEPSTKNNILARNWRTALDLTGSDVSIPGSSGHSPGTVNITYNQIDLSTGVGTTFSQPDSDGHTDTIMPTRGGNGGDVIHVICNPTNPISLDIVARNGAQIASGAGGMGGGVGLDAYEISLQPAGAHGLSEDILSGITSGGLLETETNDADSKGHAAGGFAGYLVHSPDGSYVSPVSVHNENLTYSVFANNYIGGFRETTFSYTNTNGIQQIAYDPAEAVSGQDYGWPTQIKARDPNISESDLLATAITSPSDAISNCWLLNGNHITPDPSRPIQTNGLDYHGSRTYRGADVTEAWQGSDEEPDIEILNI